MNDLSKKEELHLEENSASPKKASTSSELLQKKLESYLLLYYQAYLKGETVVETEMRAAFLNLVKQDEDLALKVRMLQLDHLNLEHTELEGAWNEATEELFPEVGAIAPPIDAHRKNTLRKYRETIFELLKSAGEFRSKS